MKQRTERSVAILIVVLVLLGTWVQAAGTPPQAGRLIAVIGIAGEITPFEARIESSKVAPVRGIVFTTGTVGGTRVVAARSTAGKVNAAMVTTLLLEHFAPSAVILTGTAGAIDVELNPADVVIGSAVGHYDYGVATATGFNRMLTRNPANGRQDPPLFPADANLLAAARRAAATAKPSRGPNPETAPAPRVHEGIILTGEAFMANPARRTELRKELNASAVEMEGAAVMQVCSRFGIPGIVIRSITDRADGSANDSYERFLEVASRNAAEFTLATIREFARGK